jgi:hypothetical protein
MTRVIEQITVFKSTPAGLYELFMDSAKHSAATGAPAKISRKVGGKWFAHIRVLGFSVREDRNSQCRYR